LANFVLAAPENGIINDTNKYAWGEDIGWINFNTTNSNVRVTDSAITGYAWSANYGWINLNPDTSGVLNDNEGNLSGYGWGENLGWIDFSAVTINSAGYFLGNAVIDRDSSRISFNCANTDSCNSSDFKVRTDWRHRSERPLCNNSLDDDGDNLIDYPDDPGCSSLTDDDETNGAVVIGPAGTTDGDGLETDLTRIEGEEGEEGVEDDLSFRPERSEERASGAEESLSFEKTPSLTEDTATPAAPKKPILKKIKEIADLFIPDFLKPDEGIPTVEIPVEEWLPKEAPLALKGDWDLLPQEQVTKFALSPLPKEFKMLAQKFPELDNTFNSVGITKIADIGKLNNVNLSLPGLTQTLGPLAVSISTSKLTLPKSIPVIDLPSSIKEKIPQDIVFVKTGGQYIDYNINLTVNDQGKPQQQVAAISGKPLHLVIKPEQKAKKIIGYIVFKKKKIVSAEIKRMNTDKKRIDTDIVRLAPPLTKGGIRGGLFTLLLQKITNATNLFAPQPALAMKKMENTPSSDGAPQPSLPSSALDYGTLPAPSLTKRNISLAPPLAKGGIKGGLEHSPESINIEEELVLLKFEYTDPDGDGIFTADIQTPVVEGEYELITVIEYEDPDEGNKLLRLTTVIDPEGYIYEKYGDKEIRLAGAVVSLYWANPATKKYELWPAYEYRQENPQTMDKTAKYSFLVPEGYYYIQVSAEEYLPYKGKPFQVRIGGGIHQNIEMRSKYWWMEMFDWRTIALIFIAIMLFYNFYKDRKRHS